MLEKILIADDNPVNRRLLRAILKNEGYQLLEAADGRQALDAALADCPDVVLLDVEMPGPDGYEVCRRIKADRKCRKTTVIFISARSKPADKIKGLELGAADYITKPFDTGEVLARVRNQVEIKRLADSLFEANKALLARQRQLEEDLKAAAQIQRSLIPARKPDIGNFDFAWRFFPCDRVGGDIFNLHCLDEKHVCAYVIDVSGHGVPAAMVTVSVRQTLSLEFGAVVRRSREIGSAPVIAPPTEVLERLDAEYPMERFGKFFTMVYMVLNIENGHYDYGCAGHPMPILIRAGGNVERLAAGGPMVGFGGAVPFEPGKGKLESGDRLFLFTDGLTEHGNRDGEIFGEERTIRNLAASRDRPLDDACEHLVRNLWAFRKQNESIDDITLLAIERSKI